jgi:hypothetical protein
VQRVEENRGVPTSSTMAEVQYAARHWTRNAGGTSAGAVDSPFIALSVPAQYNAPYFDARDPEERNRFQLSGSVTRLVGAGNRGRHEVKGGYEWFRSQRTGGSAQSATDPVFHADYLADAAGRSGLRSAAGSDALTAFDGVARGGAADADVRAVRGANL